jgi:glutamyl-tRNA synthetase
MSDRPIRVRMAPSPTGPLHIGTARTSLYNYLFARRYGGTFVLRIEDTDAARDTAAYEADILDTLHWLGISWDEGPQVAGGEDVGPYGPYRQSGRFELYAAEADRLLAAGDAYRCYCTPEDLESMRRGQKERREPPRYDGRCRRLTQGERRANEAAGRPSAVRFVVRPERIAFDDLIHGHVEFDNSLLGDFVIVRTDGVPLYHFSVVVDDHAMHISHVIRGEDHLSNTPKHIALFKALGYAVPRFGHIPLILNPDRSKMSKRLSQTALSEYRAQGYLPEAMVNFMAFLGWSPATEEELFTLHELAERFDVEHVQKAGAIFDRDRLDYLNGVYIRSLSDDQLAVRLRPFLPDLCDDETVRRLVPLVKERLARLSDVRELSGFLFETDAGVAAWYGPGDLLPKKRDADEVDGALRLAEARLAEIAQADWSAEVLEDQCRTAAEELGWKAGDFFRPLRVAVTGRTVSPPLFDSMELLGRERTLARIGAARERLVREAPVA